MVPSTNCKMANETWFDDSSDLEDSWAGEDVTFDPSPASSEFLKKPNIDKCCSQ